MATSVKDLSRRTGAFLLALMTAFIAVTSAFRSQPVQAAYHQTYIQCSIDTSTWDILAGVVDTNYSWNEASLEFHRIGSATLEAMAKADTPTDVVDSTNNRLLPTPERDGSGVWLSDEYKNLVMVFPGDAHRKNTAFWHTSSTSEDAARASLVRNSLLFSLNDAFKFVYGEDYEPNSGNNTMEDKIAKYTSDLSDFLDRIPGGLDLVLTVSEGTKTVTFSSVGENELDKDRAYPDDVTNHNDYIKITATVTNASGETVSEESRIFLYRMPKGYVPIADREFDGVNVPNMLGLRTNIDETRDAQFIHWGHFAIEAVMNYNAEEKYAVTADEVYSGTPTALEENFANLLGKIADWLTGILGLWSFDELIFSDGERGTPSYAAGIFPSSWQSLIWTFFFVAELIAFGILIYAVIFNVGKKVMSTVNPVTRAAAMEQIKYLFIVAIVLAILPALFQLLINISFNLVGAFREGLGDKTATERFKNLATNSGGLGAVLTYLVYLGAVVYFNISYGIRALSVAILIIVGPIFIALMAVDEGKRQLALAWFKELLANIFIQPLQALMLCFILMAPATSRPIDTIILAYAMIPMTNMVKSLFFGSAGNLAHQMGEKGKQTAGRMGALAGGMALGAAGGAIGGIAGSLKKGDGGKDAGGSSGGGSEGGSSGGSSGGSGGGSDGSGGGSGGGGVGGKIKGAAAAVSSAVQGNRVGQMAIGAAAAVGKKAGQAVKGATKSVAESQGFQQAKDKISEKAGQAKAAIAGSAAGPLLNKVKDTWDKAGAAAEEYRNSHGEAGEQGGAQGESDGGSAPITPPREPGGGDAAATQTADQGTGTADTGATSSHSSRAGQIFKGAAMMAAAAGLGAVGGAADQFNRRVFGYSSRSGGLATQLSRKAAGAANRNFHPAPVQSGTQAASEGEAPPTPNETPKAPNFYDRQLAENLPNAKPGMDTYGMDDETMKAQNISVRSSKSDPDTKTVHYKNIANLGEEDQMRANQLYNAWQSEGAGKKWLQEHGIQNVEASFRKGDNGEQVLSGLRVTGSGEAIKQNFGINTSPSYYDGKGITSSVAPGQSESFVPNLQMQSMTQKVDIPAPSAGGGAQTSYQVSSGVVSNSYAPLPTSSRSYAEPVTMSMQDAGTQGLSFETPTVGSSIGSFTYDFAQMNPDQAASVTQMAHEFNHGTTEQKGSYTAMGVKNMEFIKNQQGQVTGAKVSADFDALRVNGGFDIGGDTFAARAIIPTAQPGTHTPPPPPTIQQPSGGAGGAGGESNSRPKRNSRPSTKPPQQA